MALSIDVLMAFGLAIGVGVLFTALTRAKADPREPPVLQPTIPFIGHIIGMLREGPLYFARLSAKTNSPIMTLPMLTGRMYIVSDPTLASHVQRASSTLDFDQLIVEAVPRLVGVSKETAHILADVKAKDEGRIRMVTHVMHDIVKPLLTMPKMDKIGASQLHYFSKFINGIKDGQELELYKMITREVSQATTYTCYGPKNPFAVDPELLEDFWVWEDGVVNLMLRFYPQFTARRALDALEKMTVAFIKYIEDGGFDQAYELFRTRWKAHIDEGINLEDQARLEVSMCLGINVNAAITAFWVIDNIFSRPELLAEVRAEIEENALESPNTISYTKLRDACPLLNSIYRETMRIVAPLQSARYILKDTIIADTYLLRADNVVQIAGSALHTDESIWGPDVDTFNPRRFYYSATGSKTNADGSVSEEKSKIVHPAAYRAFGGGSTLCPGRHFAQLEIISLTAVMAWGFDLLPPEGRQSVGWNPPRDETRFPIAARKPLRALNVQLKRREGMENTQWVLRV